MKGAYKKGGKAGKGMIYAGAGSNVIKETKAKKAGGKCVSMEGDKPKMNLGKTKRASGGRAGADMNPFSSAHKAGK